MVRLLKAALVCTVALATAVLAQEAGRTTFTYKHPGEGKGVGTFKHTRGKEWVENGPRGERFEFREVARNKEFIELVDKRREVEVRIYANRYQWKHPKETRGKWENRLEGRWTQ
jgi:hypothetical protein